MEKNIENYVFVKQNFLDKEFCQYTIEALNHHNVWEKHFSTKIEPLEEQKLVSTSPSGENEPDMMFFPSSDIEDFLAQKILKTVTKYIDNLKFEWFKPGRQACTNLKFIKYSLNQTMKTHCDHIHSIFDGTRKGIPTLTIIGILNDDYEGGEFIMFEDKKINITEGDLIIFPSLFLFPHEVKPITKGIRYSYITWMW